MNSHLSDIVPWLHDVGEPRIKPSKDPCESGLGGHRLGKVGKCLAAFEKNTNEYHDRLTFSSCCKPLSTFCYMKRDTCIHHDFRRRHIVLGTGRKRSEITLSSLLRIVPKVRLPLTVISTFDNLTLMPDARSSGKCVSLEYLVSQIISIF
jgi:hypothetical protein